MQGIGAFPDADASEGCFADAVLGVLDKIAKDIGCNEAAAIIVVFKAESANVEARVVCTNGGVDVDEEVGPRGDGIVEALAASLAGVCIVEARPDEVGVLVEVVGHDGVIGAERRGADEASGTGGRVERLQVGRQHVNIRCV